jgi:hypothetical protein
MRIKWDIISGQEPFMSQNGLKRAIIWRVISQKRAKTGDNIPFIN